jgi:hypothetical protein
MASIFDQTRNLLKQLQTKAQPAVNNAVVNIGQSPVGRGLVGTQNFLQGNKPVQIPQLNKSAANMRIGNVPFTNKAVTAGQAWNLGRSFVNPAINLGYGTATDLGTNIGKTISGQPLKQYDQLKSPFVKAGYQLSNVVNPNASAGYNPNMRPQEILGNAGAIGEGLLSVYGGGKVFSLGKGVPAMAQRTAAQNILKGAKVSGAIGGAYGVSTGLNQGKNETLPKQFLQALESGAFGAVGGIALGGGVSALGSVFSKVGAAIQKQNPKMTPKQVNKATIVYMRNRLGRFTGVEDIKNTFIPAGGNGQPKSLKSGGIKINKGSENVGWMDRVDGELNIDPEARASLGLSITSPTSKQKAQIAEAGIADAKTGIGDIADFAKMETIKPQPNLNTSQKMGIESSKPQNTALAISPEVGGMQPRLQDLPNIQATGSTMNPTTTNPYNTQDYIKELTQKQNDAGSTGASTLKNKARSVIADIKAKMVDETSPITDILSSAEKNYKFNTRPTEDIRLQIDRVLRSKTLASQFAEDRGLVDVIKKVPDVDALDQYLIAKQAAAVEKQGIKTGRDLARDQLLINDLAPVYEPFAQQVNQFSRDLLDYSVKTGLIDEKLAKELIIKYPHYVPLQRVFNELEQGTFRGTGKGVASLSKQTIVQRIKGSEREIASPIGSLLLKTQDAFSQGERNIAAKQLYSYKDLPGFEGLINEVEAGAKAPHTFSFLDNGAKRTFATTPEIAAAAKSLNVEQMGLLAKIVATPTRVLQLGATGLNIPFVVTNMVKDEMTGFVNSSHAAQTSILNPKNYVKAMFSAVKHDNLYKDVIRNAAGGTSFDIAREAPKMSISKIRSPRMYVVKHPWELLRTLENTIGRSEEFGRIKNFEGTRQALLKEGRTQTDANLLAAQAGRENTANFARRGSFGRVLNWVIPFFNAGVQGSRQTTRSFQRAPVATSAKIATAIFTPIAVTTAWNLSDPQRKQIYSDIPQYEKENNIIIIPENPTQDARGRWNVVKIPLPPGLSNLGTIVRRSLETAEGLDPIKFSEIATNLITTGTSIDITSKNKLASTFTPQIVKPVVEATTNTNLYTGQKIVPEYLKNQLPEAQTKPGVSGVATGIGKALNVSPLMVENFAQTQLGGLGSQLLGKESAAGNLQRRFTKASGGTLLDQVYNDSTQAQAVESQAKRYLEAGRRDDALRLIQENKPILIKAERAKAYRSQVDELQQAKNKVKQDTRLTQEQKDRVLVLIQQRLTTLSQSYSSQSN